MMLTETRKKSEMTANTGFHLEKLTTDDPCFIPCTYQEDMEEITFSYNTEHLHPLSRLKEEEKKNRMQFLVNFGRLRRTAEEYKIPLTEENLYYDDNYMPYVKSRDLYREEADQISEKEFLEFYKTFVGGLLGKKFSVKQLQESGLDVLKQDQGFALYAKTQDWQELREVLRENRENLIKNEKETTVRVGRGKNLFKTILAAVSTILLLAAAAFLGYGFGYRIPRQNSVIAANEAFIRSDYIECIDSMEHVEPADMDALTKYILAVSYAKSESLKKEEMENIISRLSFLSNEKELEYWIYLGRMNYAAAEEIAQSLSDDQLLIYAYMKELDQLEGNTLMNGEEKQQGISALQDKIRQLGDKYMTEEEK